MRRAIVLGILSGAMCLCAAERWELQFFHDAKDTSLAINDLKFSSIARGVAVGVLTAKNGKTKPAMLVTSDGGRTWAYTSFKEIGTALFFLNESVGWLVTPDGIWKTMESGRSWTKLRKSPKDVWRVHFLDERNGWAVGADKGVWETKDGGQSWSRVAAADEVKSTQEYTFFSSITFVNGSTGVITGASVPPRRRNALFPDWMDPELAEMRREWPAVNILLETRDGGKRWNSSTMSLFGRITRVVLTPEGTGLGLIEFFHFFEWPSEVFRLDWHSGKSERVFRKKNRAVTDIAITPAGAAYLSGYEPSGTLHRAPVPGKLKILRSRDLKQWEDMDVDYRAVAGRAVLSAIDDNHIWVATDTGMILRLTTVGAQ
jgi:photosystem II stability/assembly factor-like uncharacterized protein